MPTPKELIEAGTHIGHQKSKWNPKMAPFVFGVRNNIHIIDVLTTIEKLDEATSFLKDVIRSGGEILFVGVKIQTREIVSDTAKKLKMPYVVGRWIGGLLTNFRVIKERINDFRSLEERRASGEIEKYTKKEQLQVKRQLNKMEDELGGIKSLEKLPKAIFVSDMEGEKIAVMEAKKMNIPVVALVDTNGDPTLADFPIPANDSSIKSLNIIYKAVAEELSGISVDPTSSANEPENDNQKKDESDDPTSK